ncbi:MULTISPECIES: hypothetical protein [Lysinibacillus]|uniref:Uncharacterized protein n=1 Tax=Lysinibacillus xylanilyticus TaxID=582475 RepID=A0ABV3VYD6_9BACI
MGLSYFSEDEFKETLKFAIDKLSENKTSQKSLLLSFQVIELEQGKRLFMQLLKIN